MNASRVPLVLMFILVASGGATFLLHAPPPVGAQTTLDRRQPRLMTEYKWASLTVSIFRSMGPSLFKSMGPRTESAPLA